MKNPLALLIQEARYHNTTDVVKSHPCCYNQEEEVRKMAELTEERVREIVREELELEKARLQEVARKRDLTYEYESFEEGSG